MSGGDSAFYEFADYGQRGDPANPCGDPPGDVGSRSSRHRRRWGSCERKTCLPAKIRSALAERLSASMLARAAVSPTTREPRAMTRMPAASSRTGSQAALRFTSAPARTRSGWATSANPSGRRSTSSIRPTRPSRTSAGRATRANEVQDEYKAELQIATFDLCRRLYAEAPGTVTVPRRTYAHGRPLVPADRCPTAGASISGLAFEVDGPYSGALGRALFLADASRGCIWAFPLLADGLPRRSTRGSWCAARVSRSTCRSRGRLSLLPRLRTRNDRAHRGPKA